ncbi:2-aminoethanethiol dioxygenase, partial [Caligus rogercresseyi]
MSPNIQRIVQFARRVASLCYERDIPFRLEGPLLEALSSLSIQELNFDSDAPFRTHKELSSYYVDIYEDNRISIGIFFLNGDTKIPLHDHPNMTGVIKCIAGNLNITSFTPIHDMSKKPEEDGGQRVANTYMSCNSIKEEEASYMFVCCIEFNYECRS